MAGPRSPTAGRSGRSRRTAAYRISPKGCMACSVQVSTTTRPPGRHSATRWSPPALMSGKKKTPYAHCTRSYGWSTTQVATSAWVKATWCRPAAAARVRADASSPLARSTPSTRPAGPTAAPASKADAPEPQHASRTHSPGCGADRATISAASGPHSSGDNRRKPSAASVNVSPHRGVGPEGVIASAAADGAARCMQDPLTVVGMTIILNNGRAEASRGVRLAAIDERSTTEP